MNRWPQPTLTRRGGADRELPTVDHLVDASKTVIDWGTDIHVARHLRALELSVRYEPEVALLLGAVWAEA